MAQWLERYRAGERVPVWTEMTAAGAELRNAPDWAIAVEVARETMTRARTNVERLIDLLPENGYRFRLPRERVFVAPPADVETQLDSFEATVGRMPLALRAWFELVGQVDLSGGHPDWEFEYPDPLVISAPLDHLASEFDDWQADRGSAWDRGAFTLDLAPDALHKADVSGGPPYGIGVPNAGVDGTFLNERHGTTFVGYLRVAFAWGGFPGWDPDAPVPGEWARPSAPAPNLLREISGRMLQI